MSGRNVAPDGFYWVLRRGEDGEWQVAEARDGRWYVTGWDSSVAEPDVIGPRIEPPEDGAA